MSVHPTWIIEKGAKIGDDVRIGPYCRIGEEVVIEKGCVLESHVIVTGDVTIGPRCHIFPFASIGTPPQDLKYQGEPTRLVIGKNNTFREFVSVNRGTKGGGGVTTIGDDNFFMVYAHIAHDCLIGDHTIFANAATLAGHVEVGHHVTIGAFSAVHQFCRVGPHAFIGGFSVLTRDALPFVKTVGVRGDAKTFDINSLGLRRKGFDEEKIKELKRVYRLIKREGGRPGRIEDKIDAAELKFEESRELLRFIRETKRGLIV